MFVKTTNDQIDKFPYSVGDLRRDNPNTSFPKTVPVETMESYGVFPVTDEPNPEYDSKTHKIERSSQPELKNGAWVITKSVVALTTEETDEMSRAEQRRVRSKRDNKLAQSDWMALSDNTLTPEWATYRQALRDITDHANFPWLNDEDWPVKPE